MHTIKAVALAAALLYAGGGAGETPDVAADSPAEAPAAAPDVAGTPPVPAASPDGSATPGAAEAPAAPPAGTADAAGTPAAAATPPDTSDAPATAPAPAPDPSGTATAPPAGTTDAADTPAAAPEAPPEADAPVSTTPAESQDAAPPPAASIDLSPVREYLVTVRDGIDSGARQAPGFSVSDEGHILTLAGDLRARDSYLVSVSGGQVFAASVLKKDEATGLLLLKIAESGHRLTALRFAGAALRPAASLYALNFDPAAAEPFTPVAGTVTQLPGSDAENPLVIHNALFNAAAAGTPLFNRCWQAVGVSVLQKTGFPPRHIDPAKQGSAVSLPSSRLSAFLVSANLSLPVAATECLSLEQETLQKLEQARQEKEAALQAERQQAEARARALTEEAQRKEETLSREKEAAQQQLEQARREKEAALQAERQQAEAEKQRLEEEAQRRLEQAQQEKEQALQAERQQAELARQQAGKATRTGRQILFYSLTFGLVLLLAFILVNRSRRKRLQGVEQEKKNMARALDQAQAELSDASEREQARSSAPDVFIEGVTPHNERIALKIPGASLVEPAGAVVGRSPAEAAFVINHEQVSRRHFRLYLVSQQVMIEDLGSTNGTGVNGAALAPGAPLPLADGSRLETGNLEFTVRVGA